jgi:hypothetical protein
MRKEKTLAKGNGRKKRLTSVLFVKCEPELYKRVARAADLTGHNSIASFVRVIAIEKILQLSSRFPELEEKNREAEAA